MNEILKREEIRVGFSSALVFLSLYTCAASVL